MQAVVSREVSVTKGEHTVVSEPSLIISVSTLRLSPVCEMSAFFVALRVTELHSLGLERLAGDSSGWTGLLRLVAVEDFIEGVGVENAVNTKLGDAGRAGGDRPSETGVAVG